jgi:hypothetical protein
MIVSSIYVLLALFILIHGLNISFSIDIQANGTIRLPLTYDNLSQSNKTRRNAVVLLIHKYDEHKLKSIVQMLDATMRDNFESDMIIFHHDYPVIREIEELRNHTKRYIDFVNVDICLSRAPNINDFDLFKNDPNWFKRGKWSYHTMIRFWFSDIFHLNVMKNVNFYMRIDDDSKFRATFPDVFKITAEREGKSDLV